MIAVIDAGIESSHKEFGNLVANCSWDFTYIWSLGGRPGGRTDSSGHGTKVACSYPQCRHPDDIYVDWYNLGRISSNLSGLINNYAWDSMDIQSYMTGAKVINQGLDTEDGANINPSQWKNADWWTNASNWYGGSTWDSNIWDITNGRLPILLNMPPGVQNPIAYE